MHMHKPAHPGEVLSELYLKPLNLTVTEAAGALAVTRQALSVLINGRSGVSTGMAMRLAKAFSTTPQLWLNMQHHYDLWVEWKNIKLSKVKVLVSGEPTFTGQTQD